MNLLTAENLTVSYSERRLFDNASFYMDEGEKVGVIGVNGTGKSTLLRIIAGEEQPDDGVVTMANNTVIRFLTQNPYFKSNQTVLQYIMDGVVEDTERWSMEAEAKSMLNLLGIYDFDILTEKMSGGQRKKTALVKVLLGKADLLILDEPTNHLDNEMTVWLEDYLKNYRGAVLMVTHDRYFLDSVVNRIVEVDKGNIYSYKTNYSGFLELKAQREEMEISTDLKKANLLRNELKWVMRGAQARSTKQKARLMRYEELKNRKRPEIEQEVEISSVSRRLGRTTVELSGISKAYGNNILISNFTYIFLKNDRIGFVGTNGCGKTTLMKIIMGEIQPDCGEVITGQTVRIGYYAQEMQLMNPEMKVIDYIRETAEYVKTNDGMASASQMLDRFLFPPKAQHSYIGKLSGGEKRRLYLLKVLMEAPNVLILDEPTNDLDIATLRILEDYLDSFEGIVITVSHDRYFLDRIARRIFAFEGNGSIRQYEGGYSDYALVKSMESEALNGNSVLEPVKEKTVNVKVKDQKLRFTYKEQQEYNTIEADIEKLENRIAEIDSEMSVYSRDFVKLNELTKEQEALNAELENKLERWDYLTDLEIRIKAQNS